MNRQRILVQVRIDNKAPDYMPASRLAEHLAEAARNGSLDEGATISIKSCCNIPEELVGDVEKKEIVETIVDVPIVNRITEILEKSGLKA